MDKNIIKNIEIVKENMRVKDFNIKKGFIIFKDINNNIISISSGWNDRGMLYVYTHQNGEWTGDWENSYDFPVFEALEILREYEKEKEMEILKLEVKNLLENGEKLYISNELERIRFIDELPGNKSGDGGDYGFFSTYYPTDIEGIYEYYTSTTCEFDTCGTGYEGLVILTKDRYIYLKEEEKKILGGEY